MKYRMPPLPRKQAVALDLLERTSVFVHLDPRRPGVIVPQGFLKQPQLVLQIGLNMAISIPDLNVGDEGISCTLSFNKRPHFCSLPWSSIYALIGEQGGGMVWPEDVPPEVVSQQRAAAKKEAKPRKPGLRAISGSGLGSSGLGSSDPGSSAPSSSRPGSSRPGSVGSTHGVVDDDEGVSHASLSHAGTSSASAGAIGGSGAIGGPSSGGSHGSSASHGGEAADRNAGDGEVPSTRRSDDVRPAVVRRDVRGSTPRPPRLVQVVSNSAHSESDDSQLADADAPRSSDAPTRDDARSPATKRSRPPYLRLVD
jgi:stringent starvation protein B